MPQAQIPQIATTRDLAVLLNLPLKDLYEKVHSGQYNSFLVSKRGGGFRLIEAPKGALALIQRRLSKILAEAYGSRSCVHGFVHKRDIKTNARAHEEPRIVFCCDIKDFFPSIHFGRVRGLFMGKPYNYPKDVAQLIARICCQKGSLPQGAPTSPIISNMICGKLDSELKHFARRHKCVYTRYADDLAFSTKLNSFPQAIVDHDATGALIPGGVLTSLLTNANFNISPTKTRLSSLGGRKEITGVVLGSKGLNVRRAKVRQIRCMLHAWELNGLQLATEAFLRDFDVQKRLEVDFAAVVRGKIEHLGHIKGRDNEIYLNFLQRFKKLEPTKNWKTIQLGTRCDPISRYRGVYVLQATDKSGYEILSTAFWLKDVGLVTANHAVRDIGGEKYIDLVIFKSGPQLDGVKVKVARASEHHDLAVLEPSASFQPTVEFVCGNVPAQGSNVTIIGYPHHNPGNPISVVTGQLVRQQVWKTVEQLVITPTINSGNSGGPILDDTGSKVIGVAVKGAGQTENLGVSIFHLSSLPSV